MGDKNVSIWLNIIFRNSRVISGEEALIIIIKLIANWKTGVSFEFFILG